MSETSASEPAKIAANGPRMCSRETVKVEITVITATVSQIKMISSQFCFTL
jgi:hypothetical protein